MFSETATAMNFFLFRNKSANKLAMDYRFRFRHMKWICQPLHTDIMYHQKLTSYTRFVELNFKSCSSMTYREERSRISISMRLKSIFVWWSGLFSCMKEDYLQLVATIKHLITNPNLGWCSWKIISVSFFLCLPFFRPLNIFSVYTVYTCSAKLLLR